MMDIIKNISSSYIMLVLYSSLSFGSEIRKHSRAGRPACEISDRTGFIISGAGVQVVNLRDVETYMAIYLELIYKYITSYI